MDVFHPWMQDINGHLNDIQMDGCHSSILQLYLSIQYVCIVVQIMYNIHFQVHECHPIQGCLSFVVLAYFDLLWGAHSMKAHSQQQSSMNV